MCLAIQFALPHFIDQDVTTYMYSVYDIEWRVFQPSRDDYVQCGVYKVDCVVCSIETSFYNSERSTPIKL